MGVNWYDHHARYYDPEIGRWFAVDPALQAASPYMAMGNNPMMMVDEDGELAFLAVVGIGAAISALTYTGSVAFSDGGFSNWDWGQFAGNTLKGAAMSAITAGITTGIGDVFSGVSNGFIKTAGSVAAHGVGQGGISYAQGGSFGTGFVSGAMGSLGASAGNLGIGRVGYGITGAAGGSLGAWVSGGNVLQGGITGGVIGLWNHGEHVVDTKKTNLLPQVNVTGNKPLALLMSGISGALSNSVTICCERFAESADATLSRFIATGSVPYAPVEGYFLEPGGPSTSVANQDRRIPSGNYDITQYSSENYHDVYQISNDNVPLARKILIHSGNYHSNTLGCFLPGKSYSFHNGNYAVWNSRSVLNNLRELIGNRPTTLITNDY